jgi:predicted DCC family thiol-disulfide oxidoreductase YuxK
MGPLVFAPAHSVRSTTDTPPSDSPTPAAGLPGGPPLLLFDGVCTLCNATVDFVLRWEAEPDLHFSALQSDYAKHVLDASGHPAAELDTVLLLENGVLLSRSNAALALCRHLKYPFRAAVIFRLVPRFLRDAMYRLVARSRYRLFGKQDHCRMPDQALRDRMHDDGFAGG